MDSLISAQTSTLIKDIQDSKLSSGQKQYFAALLQRAAEATNGLSQEQKIQAVSELSFAIVSILISKELKGHNQKENVWQSKALDTIVAVKNQLVVCVGLVTALLALRPQLAAIIESIIK